MAFLRTVQITVSASDSSLGAVDPGMKMWVRGNPGHSSFDTLVANGVYVTVNTNRQTFVAEVYGVPAAYRVSWHVADGVTSPLNYVGIACDGTAEVAASGIAKWEDLKLGAKYRIIEAKAPAGYTLLPEPVSVDALTADAPDIAITLCNNADFVLPFTGGRGFVAPILLAALMLCMGVYFCKKSDFMKENN